MFIVKYKAVFISLAIFMVAASFMLISSIGIKKGIDFTGGTIVEAKHVSTTTPVLSLETFDLIDAKAYKTADGYKFVTTKSYNELKPAIDTFMKVGGATYVETQVNNIGPSLGDEMTKKAVIAITVVVFAILLFIAFSFRKVSLPVSSWKYGVIAMITLVHDIIVPTGVYAYVSRVYGAEVDTLFIIALLTVLAVSISDKIVVFDRIRENLKEGGKRDFEKVVGDALSQTFARSINTSVTTILSLVSLLAFGPEATKFFAMTLLVGLVVGTYSSIFVASPLLIVWNNFVNKKK